MPLYVYQVIEADGSDGEVFEVLQGMSEPELTQQPGSGKRVKRLLAAPNVGRKSSGSLSDSNLERHGFTRYVKSGEGKYEKTAGRGPDAITGE